MLKSKTAPWGERPSLVKEKVATWKKRMAIKRGNSKITKINQIIGIINHRPSFFGLSIY
jgi:hypothetical protein